MYTKYWLLAMSLFFTLSACEDRIDIDLDDPGKLVVVDAWLDSSKDMHVIKLTRSQSITDTSDPTPETNASIMLITPSDTIQAIEIEPGAYQVNHRPTEIGKSYALNILLTNGTLIKGQTIMGDVPQIDSITTEFIEGDLRGPDGIYAEFFARDLPGFGNTYWIKTFKNNVFLNKPQEINLAYDAGFDPGARLDNFIFITPIRFLINPVPSDDEVLDEVPPYISGDTIRVEIHSLSEETFDFLAIARDQLINGDAGIFASPIANALGNLTTTGQDEVLGAFNVAHVSSLEMMIP